MKQFIYITMAPIDESSGVYKKIIAQVNAFNRLGYEGKVLFVRDTSTAYLRSIDGSTEKTDLTKITIKDELSRNMLSCEFCVVQLELWRHTSYRMRIFICKTLKLQLV